MVLDLPVTEVAEAMECNFYVEHKNEAPMGAIITLIFEKKEVTNGDCQSTHHKVRGLYAVVS